jgi:hypothetical protein|tara:strand:+ start:494 stop:1102 length:609 start_codon:yes stop_codon:yes gene_type:complete
MSKEKTVTLDEALTKANGHRPKQAVSTKPVFKGAELIKQAVSSALESVSAFGKVSEMHEKTAQFLDDALFIGHKFDWRNRVAKELKSDKNDVVAKAYLGFLDDFRIGSYRIQRLKDATKSDEDCAGQFSTDWGRIKAFSKIAKGTTSNTDRDEHALWVKRLEKLVDLENKSGLKNVPKVQRDSKLMAQFLVVARAFVKSQLS